MSDRWLPGMVAGRVSVSRWSLAICQADMFGAARKARGETLRERAPREQQRKEKECADQQLAGPLTQQAGRARQLGQETGGSRLSSRAKLRL